MASKLSWPQRSHECALKLTDLWIKSLLFDLNNKLINWSFAFSPGQIYILSHCQWELFFRGGGGGVELWLILLNMGYYTLYEESYILEIQKSNNYETISTSKKEL